jgi:hypothetical protein
LPLRFDLQQALRFSSFPLFPSVSPRAALSDTARRSVVQRRFHSRIAQSLHRYGLNYIRAGHACQWLEPSFDGLSRQTKTKFKLTEKRSPCAAEGEEKRDNTQGLEGSTCEPASIIIYPPLEVPQRKFSSIFITSRAMGPQPTGRPPLPPYPCSNRRTSLENHDIDGILAVKWIWSCQNTRLLGRIR